MQMRRVITILITICLFAQGNSKFVIIADYYLNKDYIATNLCENRAHPEKNCCGKCYLKKKLDKDEKEQSPSGNKHGKEEVTLFCEQPKFIIPEAKFAFEVTKQFSYADPLTEKSPGSIFRPPQV